MPSHSLAGRQAQGRWKARLQGERLNPATRLCYGRQRLFQCEFWWDSQTVASSSWRPVKLDVWDALWNREKTMRLPRLLEVRTLSLSPDKNRKQSLNMFAHARHGIGGNSDTASNKISTSEGWARWAGLVPITRQRCSRQSYQSCSS